MNITSNPMGKLYRRLNKVGFSRQFVQEVALPSWWDDDAAEDPVGYSEGLMLLSKHLGLDLASLRDPSSDIQFCPSAPFKLKTSKHVDPGDVDVSRILATRVAELVALSVRDERPMKAGTTALAIRRAILNTGRPWVGLKDLINSCWARGIPVVQLSTFPDGAKRMHGLAVRVGERPVIVISKKDRHPAWSLFILAHELGHVMLGHIEADSSLVDEDIAFDSHDVEEACANEFALELLTGHPSRKIVAPRALGAWTLAKEALRQARELQTDPGHIVLNYSYSTGLGTSFAGANAALRYIDQGVNGMRVTHDAMFSNLEWDRIPPAGREFVENMTRIDDEVASV